MGNPDAAPLLSLAESIADGGSIDWSAAEARAGGADEAIVRQLRVISELADLHRSVSTVTIPPPDATRSRHASAAPAIGSWGHLTLLERLGGGSSGDVYRAWDRVLERDVALKLLRFNDSIADLDTSRITHEGRLLARVRHPNVITVFGVAAHDNRVGLWMELVRGATLEQQIRTSGPLGAHEAALVGIDLCRALAAIHAAGLIHRDVKCQNVMREGGGRIVLMDLGTGREVGAPSDAVAPDLAGTPLYLAPELFSGAQASERTDLYSLGVLLYHLVTGIFPIRATTIQELHEGHTAGRLVRLRDARPDLPSPFVRVVERAIASDARVRYATAGAFEADLAVALEADVAVPAAAGRTSTPSGGRSRKRLPWVAAGIVAIAVAAATLVGLRMNRSGSGVAAPAAVPGKVKLAVLPFKNSAGNPQVSEWPQLIQALFVDEVAGVQNISIADPLSMNSALGNVLETPQSRQSPRLLEVLRRSGVTMVIDGAILRTGDGYQLQINLIDVASGENRFPARVLVAGEDGLGTAVRSLADGILGFVQLQVLQLANDKDLRPWMSFRRQNIQAVNAFLQASQYIYRFERVAGYRYLERAIQLDPSFIVPRVWLIPALVSQNKMEEARASYQHLLTLEPNASPFEQAMIAFAGAILTNDLSAQATHLEVALEYLPGNNILLANLAETRELKGDCAGALDAMRPAVDMRWQYPPLYSLWGLCSIETGRLADARAVLTDATSFRIVHPNVYGLLEALAIADGDAAAAEAQRKLYTARRRELDQPADPTEVLKAYSSLGRQCVDNGQFDRAAILFGKASAMEPKAAGHHNDLGDLYQKKGDVAAAERQYSEALKVDPGSARAWLMLGRIRDARKDAAGAARFYRGYLARESGPEADAVRARLRELESAGARRP